MQHVQHVPLSLVVPSYSLLLHGPARRIQAQRASQSAQLNRRERLEYRQKNYAAVAIGT